MEIVDECEHVGNTARNVLHIKLQQNDACFVGCTLQIADFFERGISLLKLLLGSLRINKQRVRIHRLVVVDACYIDAQ